MHTYVQTSASTRAVGKQLCTGKVCWGHWVVLWDTALQCEDCPAAGAHVTGQKTRKEQRVPLWEQPPTFRAWTVLQRGTAAVCGGSPTNAAQLHAPQMSRTHSIHP